MRSINNIVRLLLLMLFAVQMAYAKPITIGALAFHPPFCAKGPSTGQGFEVDLILAACKRMKRKCTIHYTNYRNLWKGLHRGKYDLAIGGFIIPSERSDTHSYSLPYLETSARFITLSKNKVKKVDELKGKRLGILHRIEFLNYIEKNHPNMFVITTHKSVPDLINELKNDKIDIIFMENYHSRYWMANYGSLLKYVGKKHLLGVGIGIRGLPDKVPLLNEFSKQIVKMEKDGTYLKYYKLHILGFK
jgi:ABC-type amino acid transport substrate-binding protein